MLGAGYTKANKTEFWPARYSLIRERKIINTL